MIKVIVLLAILLTTSFILTPVIINHFQINNLNEPELKTYSSDEMSFLKTFYLMEKGEGYYSAFKLARENFAVGNLIRSDVFTWRMPTVFYLWKICCQSGQQILTMFIFLSALSILLIYLIFFRWVGRWALFSPLALVPYFYDSLVYKSAFLFMEWWAILFFIIGLYGLSIKSRPISIIGFFLAAITRELFIIPVLLMFIFSLFRKKDWQIFAVVIGVSFLVFVIHAQNVSNLVTETKASVKVWERFHFYSLENLQKMVSFSMRQYVLAGLKTHYIVLLLGMASLLIGLIKTRILIVKYIAISVFSFLVVLPLISVKENDYWGIMFVPLILMSIPLLLTTKE